MSSIIVFKAFIGIAIIGVALYMLANLWAFGSQAKTKRLHSGRNLRDIFSGNLYKSFSDKRDSEVIAGFKINRQRKGLLRKRTSSLSIKPTGTYSNQAVHKTLSK